MRKRANESKNIDLLFAGPVYCDLVFSGVSAPAIGTEVHADTFTMTPGGTANRALAAARLGADTTLLSELGDDPLGAHVLSVLRRQDHLDLRHVRVTEGRQSPVTIALTGAHDRSFITYEEPSDNLIWQDNQASVGATHIDAAVDLPDWVRGLRTAGTTVVAGVGWDPTNTWSPDVLRRLEDVDIFVPNDVEAMKYTHTHTAADAARELGRYVKLAVVTRGPRGAIAYDSGTGKMTEVAAIAVDAVDPTGAGDVFVASFMASLKERWSLETQLQFSSLCASLSVLRLGGATSAPTVMELENYLSTNEPPGNWTPIRRWVSSFNGRERESPSGVSSSFSPTSHRREWDC